MNNHSKLQIVAGESIPYIREAFGDLGDIRFLPGRDIDREVIQGTDVLLVRSITRVNEALLKDAPVKFVGSASAGTDHIDFEYLKAHNIGFASAAGCNANSVAEYVVSALFRIAQREGRTLKGKSIGIIGVGHIGKLVKKKAEALGMQPVLNDPPLAEMGLLESSPLEETLACDVVTLHTPLRTEGPFPTFHLLNEQTFRLIKPSTIFINSSRGEVVDTEVLLDAIIHERIGPTVIDVWEHEPHISWDLFQAVTLGTPHIAGHSLDGKANGTFMIYEALCRYLGVKPTWNPTRSLPEPEIPSIALDSLRGGEEEQIGNIVARVYDINKDYDRMAKLLESESENRPSLFDELRKYYPVRREFHSTHLKLSEKQVHLVEALRTLGFLLSDN